MPKAAAEHVDASAELQCRSIIRGKYIYIADKLSRAYIHGVSCANEEDDIWEVDYILVTERRLSKLRTATRDD